LSTVTHWQREVVGWTGLNTIVYHGSAKDRERIRELEFAYPKDRPRNHRVNAKYLKNCEPAKKDGIPWMVTVVITTPEILVADDWAELTSVTWKVLVVDEVNAVFCSEVIWYFTPKILKAFAYFLNFVSLYSRLIVSRIIVRNWPEIFVTIDLNSNISSFSVERPFKTK
jgi:hypothetical protein